MNGARGSTGSAQRHARHQRIYRRIELQGGSDPVCSPWRGMASSLSPLSDAIPDETIRVLREKFGWDGYRLHDARRRLASLTKRVGPTQELGIKKENAT